MKQNPLLKTNALLCLIIALGFFVTSWISCYFDLGILKRDVERVSALAADGICRLADSIFTEPVNLSRTMANDRLLKDLLAKEWRVADDDQFIEDMCDYLSSYQKEYRSGSIYLISARSNRKYHLNGIVHILNSEGSENKWLESFLKAPEKCVLEIENDGANDHGITAFVSHKITGEGGVAMGAVSIGFSVDELREVFRSYEDRFGLRAYLIDNSGTVSLSSGRSGIQGKNLFDASDYGKDEERMLSEEGEPQSSWYSSGGQSGYLEIYPIPGLGRRLLVQQDTSALEALISRRFYMKAATTLLVIVPVLVIVRTLIRSWNAKIARLIAEDERKHGLVFKAETEKIYETIYEIDITHNRAASEAAEQYFESLGVPGNTPYDQALAIMAQKQVREEDRQGYLSTFCPDHVMKAYQAGTENLRFDFMITADRGISYQWMRIIAAIFWWDTDRSVRMFVYLQNVDEEKKRELSMHRRIESDPLTGLYNKTATQEHIHRMLSQEPEKSYAFFILDIDDFKKVNDTCGHAAGDRVISDFADILKGQFRANDVIGRIGGDEFVVFVPAPSRDWVERKAHGLVTSLHHEFRDGEKRCMISSSVGVAMAPDAGGDFETLYRNADQALYRTKGNRKDGFTIY